MRTQTKERQKASKRIWKEAKAKKKEEEVRKKAEEEARHTAEITLSFFLKWANQNKGLAMASFKLKKKRPGIKYEVSPWTNGELVEMYLAEMGA